MLRTREMSSVGFDVGDTTQMAPSRLTVTWESAPGRRPAIDPGVRGGDGASRPADRGTLTARAGDASALLRR